MRGARAPAPGWDVRRHPGRVPPRNRPRLPVGDPVDERRPRPRRLRPDHRLRLRRLRAVGQRLVPRHRRRRLQRGLGRVLPALPGPRQGARIRPRVEPRRRRPSLARRRGRRGVGAPRDRETRGRRGGGARQRPAARALPDRVRLHLCLLGRALPRPRDDVVPRRAPRAALARGCARGARGRDAADGARPPPRPRRALLAEDPSADRAARAGRAPALHGARVRRARVRPRPRRLARIHARAAVLGPGRLAARSARRDLRGRPGDGAQHRRARLAPGPRPHARRAVLDHRHARAPAVAARDLRTSST